MLLSLVCGLCACHTVKRTTTRSSDTLIYMQPVSIPYDTVVYTQEHSASVILPLPDNSLFLPDTTITQDGITTTIGIQGGRASVKSRVSALPIQVKGNARGSCRNGLS